MNTLSGLVSMPRLLAHERGTGFFVLSATVKEQIKPGLWLINTPYNSLQVYTDLSLTPGQRLQLQLVEKTSQRLIYQVIPVFSPTTPAIEKKFSVLISAFIARGLPLLEEKIKKVQQTVNNWGFSAHSNAKEWAVNLDVKDLASSNFEQRLLPWVRWESQVEQGQTPDFPDPDDELWDLWNLRKDKVPQQWITLPFHFSFQNKDFSALLKALIDPVLNKPLFWSITTTAMDIPLQVIVHPQKSGIEIKLIFFKEEDFLFYTKCVILLSEKLPKNIELKVVRNLEQEQTIVDKIDEQL